jgi:hypothetical protein
VTGEPSTSVGLTAGAILLAIGPDGHHALIVAGALGGVMHSLGRAHTPTRTAAALYIVKWVFTAALLTGFVSAMLQQHVGLPADRWPGVVAFGITFLADRWSGWLSSYIDSRMPGGADGGKGPQA